jgi:pyruvate dehydrogenase E2 component (dihydrolipoamide acetyltransferase)
VEVPVHGVLRRILVPVGEVAAVGTLLAVIADPGVADQEIDAFIAKLSGADGSADAASAEPSGPEPPPAGQSPAAANTVPLTAMRAAIARTVTAGWTIPQFPVTVAIEMENAEKLYRRLKDGGGELSLNDLIVKAAAVALQKFPMAHASLVDDQYLLHPEINISVAVGLEDGLVLPVIKGCQELSLQEIAAKSRELIERAKSGRASEADLCGGNFSISNLGMFGVEAFAALVPPGQAAILAVGAVQDEAVVKGGQVVIARRMRATLTADHRIVDGVYSARYMAELKAVLEAARLLEG